jgi:erythromycin esterase
LRLAPGTYAVATASVAGWYWSEKVEVSTAPLSLTLSADCARHSGRVKPMSGAELRGASLLFSRVSYSYGDEFLVPIRSDDSFEACLPNESLIVKADGPVLTLPVMVTPSKSPRLELAAFPRASILEPAPAPAAKGAPLDTASFVAEIPGDVSIVAIGEANHGAREFLELRLDLSRRLARERGFRLVMIEAGFGETLALDRYVRGEDVDVRKAVENLGYWIWDTEEFLGVLAELRAYNAKAAEGERIRFWGLDVQHTAGCIAAILATSGIEEVEKSLLERLIPDRGEAWKAMSEAERSSVMSVLSRIERAKPDSVEGLSALSLRYRMETMTLPLAEQVTHRDEGMARMVIAARKTAPEGKVILWAHNGHVAREPSDGYPAMGGVLAAHDRRSYYPIALLLAGGRSRAWDQAGEIGVIPHEAAPVEPFQVEQLLLKTTGGALGFVIPSRLPPESRKWLATPRYMSEFGSAINRELTLYDSTRAFAAFGLIPVASPTTPTPTGIRDAAK